MEQQAQRRVRGQRGQLLQRGAGHGERALTSSTLAAACPAGNVLRWFAHVDGSPDWLGWGPAVP